MRDVGARSKVRTVTSSEMCTFGDGEDPGKLLGEEEVAVQAHHHVVVGGCGTGLHEVDTSNVYIQLSVLCKVIW